MKSYTSLKPFIYLAHLLVLLSLVGCGPSQEQIAAQTATAQTAVAALWTATPTATAAPTLTFTPTITPSFTPTQKPTLTPTTTPTSTPVDDQRTSFKIKDVTVSFVAPEDCERASDPDHVIYTGTDAAGNQLILTFSLDQYTMLGSPMNADEVGIAFFSAHVQDTVAEIASNIVEVSEDFIVSADGGQGFRWVLEHKTNGKELHQAFYIFGSGEWFLTVMYGRPIKAGVKTDAVIDEAMQTIRFEQ